MTEIGGSVFKNNSNLHVLNIAHNKISNINQEAFKSLKNLRGEWTSGIAGSVPDTSQIYEL